jgi:hypothetical protein
MYFNPPISELRDPNEYTLAATKHEKQRKSNTTYPAPRDRITPYEDIKLITSKTENLNFADPANSNNLNMRRNSDKPLSEHIKLEAS